MSWSLVIALIMLTPFGWVGLICSGVALYLMFAGIRGLKL